MDESAKVPWPAFGLDTSGDGQFTLTDVWLWLAQLFFLPGDGLLWALWTYAPDLAAFLELGPASYGGLVSAIVSAAAWFLAFVIVGAAYARVRDFDRALTQRVIRSYDESLRWGRVARRWLVCQARRLKAALSLRRRQDAVEIDLAEIDLDDLDMEVLRSHALLAPGYVMSVSDLAASLEIRRPQAQQLLTKLEKLALLQRALGTDDGETGYRLSRPGSLVLEAHGRN